MIISATIAKAALLSMAVNYTYLETLCYQGRVLHKYSVKIVAVYRDGREGNENFIHIEPTALKCSGPL